MIDILNLAKTRKGKNVSLQEIEEMTLGQMDSWTLNEVENKIQTFIRNFNVIDYAIAKKKIREGVSEDAD